MRILITGGAGFIGSNLCREFLTRSGVDQVTVIDDFSSGKMENVAGLAVDVVKETVLNCRAMTQLVREHDSVVHLAAQPSVPLSIEEPILSHEVNTNGTVNVLEACREFKKPFVFASSSAVYGTVDQLPVSESLAARPRTPYAANKLAAESYALAYAASYHFPVAAFRFFNVYGPMQSPGHAYAAVIPSFVDAALRHVPITIHGDGTQTRDFTYVGSVSEVIADTVVSRIGSDSPVNLAFGTRTMVIDVARKIEEILGRSLDIRFAPARAGDIHDSQASCGHLRSLLPARSDRTLGDGLRATIDWFESTQHSRVSAT